MGAAVIVSFSRLQRVDDLEIFSHLLGVLLLLISLLIPPEWAHRQCIGQMFRRYSSCSHPVYCIIVLQVECNTKKTFFLSLSSYKGRRLQSALSEVFSYRRLTNCFNVIVERLKIYINISSTILPIFQDSHTRELNYSIVSRGRICTMSY